MKRERARRRSRRRRRVGKSSGACPNTAWGISKGTPQDGQLHFSRNLRENANARGIWQQWPWSAAPILRVGFSVEGKGGQDDEGRGQGIVRGRGRRTARFAGHAKQLEVQRQPPRPTSGIYQGSPNPLIRVDSHDRLEGYPPTNPPLLIHPLPSGAIHPPLSPPVLAASSPRKREASGLHSDSQHA